MISADTLAAALGGKKSGAGWMAKCPAHDDGTASLSINERDGKTLVKCHAGCEQNLLIDVLAARDLDLRSVATGLSVFEFATAKGLPPAFLAENLVTDVALNGGTPAVAFEYRNSVGERTRTKFRRGMSGARGFFWNKGLKQSLYGLWRPIDASKPLILVEGESDSLTLWHHGFQALGLPGANSWREGWAGELPASGDIFVIVEPDKGGEATMAWLNRSRIRDRAKIVKMPKETKDPSALYLADRGNFKRKFDELLAAAQPVEAVKTELTADPSAGVLKLAAALSAIEYDRRREAIAVSLSIRVSTLDSERAKRQAKDAVTPAFSLSDPNPWPDAVAGHELADAIRCEISRYIVISDVNADACALWALMTWCAESLFLLPMLSISSPQKRCGKSNLLILLRHLTRRALLVANTSPAALFRVVDKYQPTLLLDEADAWFKENEELRGIINAGHSRDTAVVMRTTGEDFDPKPFNVFCPKAIASIGSLADTIQDRSIEIALRRRAPNESVERLRQDRLGYPELQRKALRWSIDAATSLKAADPDIPQELHDRAADNWRPLIAIADLCGGAWPARARSAAIALSAKDADEEDVRTLLLSDIRNILAIHDRITSASLVNQLTQLDDRPWSEWKHGRPMSAVQLSRLLKPFGIRPAPHRIGGDIGRGYIAEQFADAFVRYLPKTANRTVTPLQTEYLPGKSDESSVTRIFSVTDRTVTPEKCLTGQLAKNSGINSICNGVTDQNPKREVIEL